MLAVQEEIARSIMNALEVRLGDSVAARMIRPARVDVAAYSDYLRGNQLLERAPGDAGSHGWYQNLLRIQGRFEEALSHGHRAVQLDPLSAIRTQDLALTYYYARRFDEAVTYYRHAADLDAGIPVIHMRLAMALSALGRHDEAIASARTGVSTSAAHAPVLLAGLARVLADAGQRDSARIIVRDLQGRRAAGMHVDAVYLAAALTGLGEHERALTELERAFEERSANLVSMKVHVWHDALRNEPRFNRLLQRMALD